MHNCINLTVHIMLFHYCSHQHQPLPDGSNISSLVIQLTVRSYCSLTLTFGNTLKTNQHALTTPCAHACSMQSAQESKSTAPVGSHLQLKELGRVGFIPYFSNMKLEES